MGNQNREHNPAPTPGDPTKLEFRDEHKVAILLELFKNATEQMAEIKREEMSWLKVFLLLYGSIAAWSIQRWMAQTQIASSDFGLIWAVILFSFAATLVFCVHFLRARWSYYGVSERLVRAEALLNLSDKSSWGGLEPPMTESAKIGHVVDYDTWTKNAKPFYSFLTRTLYLLCSNLTIDFIAFFALKRVDQSVSYLLLVIIVLANLLMVFIIFLADFLHFYVRPRASQIPT